MESDLRSLYAAWAISYLLNDLSGINIEKATSFILSCQNYDYAFGFSPGEESHSILFVLTFPIIRNQGAATFLAVASLILMNKNEAIPNKGQIVSWCINRQVGGFQVLAFRYL